MPLRCVKSEVDKSIGEVRMLQPRIERHHVIEVSGRVILI